MRAKGAAIAGLIGATIALSGCSLSTPTNSTATGTGGPVSCTGGIIPGLNQEQSDIARTIAEEALSLGLGQHGVTIGETVGLTESGLRNVGYGDMMGPIGSDGNRTMSSSRGVFQQLKSWGPEADRTNPQKAARMFFTGGQIVPDIPNDGEESGLMDITGWQNMSVPAAAQAVQRSEFTDGSNFAAQLDKAKAITTEIMKTCTAPGSGGANQANGPLVTLPNNQFVAEAVRGKTIQAPNAQVAKGLAAGFDQLGLPYVWGGGGSGAGANDGCSRGGGALNSCQGLTGFDCSGLTAYVLAQGGYQIPDNSTTQRGGGQPIPKDQAQPGDIYGFPGHVSISLGFIDGQAYHLEASTVGTPVHIVAMKRSDVDSNVHRYWSGDGVQ